MIEIQEGLLKEEHEFFVNGQPHYNSRLYAKEVYHFYDVKEHKERLEVVEREKNERRAKGEVTEDLVVEKNYTTFAITPITDTEILNSTYKCEKI